MPAVCWRGNHLATKKEYVLNLPVACAAALVVVVLAHVFEALHVFPRIGWGSQNSVGHYLDLLCAILGVTLFSLGYLIHAMDTCVQKKSERV
jgi:hypothetical protein